jgi:uncharacterized protein YecA (UPF0149 family)
MLAAIGQISDGESELSEEAQAELTTIAPDLIPSCVQTLYAARPDFGQDQAQRPETRNKPGRNAPCPCGSGKKYKKCCGAN